MSKSSFNSYKIALCFIISAILIVFVLPRKGQFKYEYSKGKPWIYEQLNAPFNFPIYKSDEELSKDKQDVEQHYKPYFRMDNAIGQQELDKLANDISHNSISYRQKQLLTNAFEFIYQRGIWQISELKPEYAERKDLLVAVVNNNVSVDYPASQLFTPASAYSYISKKLQDSLGHNQVSELTAKLKLQQYILANLSYDENTTIQVRNNELADIPITKGVVSEGKKLIGKGEIVSPAVYQQLESLRKEYTERTGYTGSMLILIVGQVMLVILCLSCLFVLLRIFRPDMLMRSSSLIFVLILVVGFVYITMFAIKSDINIYLIPLAIIPIYISTFFYARPAMFVHWVVLLLIGFYVPNSFEFILINFAAGIASIISFRTMYRRGRLFVAIGTILAAYCFSYISIQLIQEGTLANISWSFMLNFVINVLIILTAYQLVYVFEKIFGFLSNVTLMELSDTNRKLLRKLAETAPGTFQHSMQVANLAETVAHEIGGNPLLVRCGALYHDIGKMENPVFFIENQAKGFNPHDALEPEQSAAIIIKHVEDGVQLAKKHNLPAAIIDFIRSHHATSVTRYFYNKYVEKHPDATDFSKFTYPGPAPAAKETAIVMMADSLEAASRSLNSVTEDAINSLVDSIVGLQAKNGYFSNVSITFKELEQAKQIFKKKLRNIYHPRIEYPEIK